MLEDSIMITFNNVIEKNLFSVFLYLNLPTLEDSIIIIFNYVSENILFYVFYFKIFQFWKIQLGSSSTMSLKTFHFCFSILKYLNILKLSHFGNFNNDQFQLCCWKLFIFIFYYKIFQYFETSQFWKIQAWPSLTQR